MVSNQDWAQAFEIDPAKLEELQNSCPPEMPLIALVLEHGLITQNAYLAWAREKYELPSLKDAFFQSGKALSEINTPGGLEPWNPHFVPVYQWEGTLFVGCLEPQFLPAEGFQLVLCGAEALRQHYEALSSDMAVPSSTQPQAAAIPVDAEPSAVAEEAGAIEFEVVSEPVAEPTAEPVAEPVMEPAAEAASPATPPPLPEIPSEEAESPSLDFNMGELPTLSDVEVSTPQNEAAPDEAVAHEAPAMPEAPEAPAAVAEEDTPSPPSLDFDFGGIETATDVDVPAEDAAAPAAPDLGGADELPPTPTVDETPEDSSDAIAAPDFNFDIAGDALVATDAVAPEADAVAEVAGAAAAVAAATPPPPPAAPDLSGDILSAPSDDVLSAPADDVMAAPPAPPAAPAAPAAPAVFEETDPGIAGQKAAGTMTETAGNEKIDDWSEGLFDQMDKYFDGKMVITRMDEGFAPRFWTGHWQPKSKSSPFVNIDEANIFRIAFRTRRPFHGQISPNEVNDSFFEFWNGKNYPHEITIHPIVKDGEVAGMIVGVPRNSEQNHKKLRLIETVCNNAANSLQSAA